MGNSIFFSTQSAKILGNMLNHLLTNKWKMDSPKSFIWLGGGGQEQGRGGEWRGGEGRGDKGFSRIFLGRRTGVQKGLEESFTFILIPPYSTTSIVRLTFTSRAELTFTSKGIPPLPAIKRP